MTNYTLVEDQDELFPIELAIISFRNYVDNVENYFLNQKKSLLEKHSKILLGALKSNGNGSNLKKDRREFYGNIVEIEIEFIQKFRTSILTQIFSFLESELKKICKTLESKNKEFIFNDARGSNEIDKVKNYLNQHTGIEIGKYKSWQFITNLRLLRNKIIHENSTVSSEKEIEQLFKFAENHFTFSSPKPKEYLKFRFDNREFIDLCINTIEIFLIQLSKDYYEWETKTNRHLSNSGFAQ